MPLPFTLDDAPPTPDTPHKISVSLDATRLKVHCPSAQALWDTAQESLLIFPGLLTMTPTVHIRLDTKTKDHRRSYCTVHAPASSKLVQKYIYKFYGGIGEWVATEKVPLHNHHNQTTLQPDFYGRLTAPVDQATFWGLDALLSHAWYASHTRSCKAAHYDVFVYILPLKHNAAAGSPAELLAAAAAASGENISHLQVCADAHVATLFRMLVGLDRSGRQDSLANCLTEVVGLASSGRAELGRVYHFGEVVKSEITMQETGWFEDGESAVRLVPSRRAYVLSKKFRPTFSYEEMLPY